MKKLSRRDVLWALQLSIVAILSFYVSDSAAIPIAATSVVLGILASMTLKDQKLSTIPMTVAEWYISVIIATILMFFLAIAGYTLIGYLVVIFVFMLISFYTQLTDCMVIGIVITTQYYGIQPFTWNLVGQKFGLLTAGVIVAVVVKVLFEFINSKLAIESN